MPQQALALGNSELALKQAGILAGRLLQEAGNDPSKVVDLAFRTILARRPTAAEVRECEAFLDAPLPASTDAAAKARRRAVESLILVLFNHSDFVTVR